MVADSKNITLLLFNCVVALELKKMNRTYCIISKFNIKVSMSLFELVDGVKMDIFYIDSIVSHV